MSQPPFTAAEVRRLAHEMRTEYLTKPHESEPVALALDAFAARLEQDAHAETLLADVQQKWSGVGASAADTQAASLEAKAREEGRREVLREIAEREPVHDGLCLWCDGYQPQSLQSNIHKPDCLWLRAHQATQPQVKQDERQRDYFVSPAARTLVERGAVALAREQDQQQAREAGRAEVLRAITKVLEYAKVGDCCYGGSCIAGDIADMLEKAIAPPVKA